METAQPQESKEWGKHRPLVTTYAEALEAVNAMSDEAITALEQKVDTMTEREFANLKLGGLPECINISEELKEFKLNAKATVSRLKIMRQEPEFKGMEAAKMVQSAYFEKPVPKFLAVIVEAQEDSEYRKHRKILEKVFQGIRRMNVSASVQNAIVAFQTMMLPAMDRAQAKGDQIREADEDRDREEEASVEDKALEDRLRQYLAERDDRDDGLTLE